MNKQRLLRLADMIEKVSPDKYRQRTWLSADPRNTDSWKFELVHERRVLKEGFCGSAACVLGHAAMDEEFRKEGLVHYRFGGGDCSVGLITEGSFVDDPIIAAMQFFDIDEASAMTLFDGGEDLFHDSGSPLGFYSYYVEEGGRKVKPRHVGKAIREFVETDGGNVEDYLDDRLKPIYEREGEMAQ